MHYSSIERWVIQSYKQSFVFVKLCQSKDYIHVSQSYIKVLILLLQEMSKDADIIRQPIVHRSVILGVGIMSHKLVNLHIKMGLPPSTTSALIKNIVRVGNVL